MFHCESHGEFAWINGHIVQNLYEKMAQKWIYIFTLLGFFEPLGGPNIPKLVLQTDFCLKMPAFAKNRVEIFCGYIVFVVTF